MGFWPGGGNVTGAAFYSYMAPQPEGFGEAAVHPAAAFYRQAVERIPADVRCRARIAVSPSGALLDLRPSTYEAGANLANWDRKSLEHDFTSSASAA